MSADHVDPGGPRQARGLRVEVDHEESDLAVVFVRGELDRTTVPVLVSRLRTVMDAGSAGGAVVVNLAGMTFIDVGGMCCLLDAAGRATARGSRLYLAGCSAQLMRLVYLTDVFGGVSVIPSGRL
jgi:anti-anti-sigma factor